MWCKQCGCSYLVAPTIHHHLHNTPPHPPSLSLSSPSHHLSSFLYSSLHFPLTLSLPLPSHPIPPPAPLFLTFPFPPPRPSSPCLSTLYPLLPLALLLPPIPLYSPSLPFYSSHLYKTDRNWYYELISIMRTIRSCGNCRHTLGFRYLITEMVCFTSRLLRSHVFPPSGCLFVSGLCVGHAELTIWCVEI